MIARTYTAAANPDGAYFDGVPLADVDQDIWDGLPAWLQRSVDACGFYSVPPAPDGGVLSAEEATLPTPRKSRG